VTEERDGQPAAAEIVPVVRSAVSAELGLLSSAPHLAKVAAVSAARLAGWSLNTAAAATSLVARHALSGESPQAVIQNIAVDLRTAAWHALGLQDETDPHGVPESIAPTNSTVDDLRMRGEDLMRRSNDVRVTEDTHPAFARILGEITPDEARILRFLYLEGPQPSIDIRTNRPLGIGSTVVADGLNLIAEQAGCRNVERIHPYLTNLFRLGLIEFPKEQVSNPQRYQLLEAQPKVHDALRRAGRWPRIVRRSIRLTAFGGEFCETCLPVSGYPMMLPRAQVIPPQDL
jgi:hypothetical protein